MTFEKVAIKTLITKKTATNFPYFCMSNLFNIDLKEFDQKIRCCRLSFWGYFLIGFCFHKLSLKIASSKNNKNGDRSFLIDNYFKSIFIVILNYFWFSYFTVDPHKDDPNDEENSERSDDDNEENGEIAGNKKTHTFKTIK